MYCKPLLFTFYLGNFLLFLHKFDNCETMDHDLEDSTSIFSADSKRSHGNVSKVCGSDMKANNIPQGVSGYFRAWVYLMSVIAIVALTIGATALIRIHRHDDGIRVVGLYNGERNNDQDNLDTTGTTVLPESDFLYGGRVYSNSKPLFAGEVAGQFYKNLGNNIMSFFTLPTHNGSMIFGDISNKLVDDTLAVIIGGAGNEISGGGNGSIIAGGGENLIIRADASVVVGGSFNNISFSVASFITGGDNNTIELASSASILAGNDIFISGPLEEETATVRHLSTLGHFRTSSIRSILAPNTTVAMGDYLFTTENTIATLYLGDSTTIPDGMNIIIRDLGDSSLFPVTIRCSALCVICPRSPSGCGVLGGFVLLQATGDVRKYIFSSPTNRWIEV